ncbi:alpha/beta hydrolase [Rahnella sp. AA]|uniref:alpha/beta fold hydrolase n=1 Tax=Rahnella sp. AA TaxID=2057180 RepID=UPI000C3464B1|nr:alpha/beta hydrolase [Rahnella sp. AA]PKE29449.1 alpha/beta hydrolase [Rahnella sp. AA]
MKILSNGNNLNVTDTQKGETALVFLHFWGGSSQTWDPVVALLRDTFRCIAIDARGAGESEAPDEGYRTQDHADDVLNVITALGLTRYILVGHSMGGKAAQLLASRQPEGLAGLVLVASSPLSPMNFTATQRGQMKSTYASREAVIWTLENVLTGSAVSEHNREQLITDALRLSPQATAGWIDTGMQEDLRDKAAQINVPVVIIAGELDRVDPVAVVKAHIIASYPLADVYFLENKGHLLPVEAPQQIADIITTHKTRKTTAKSCVTVNDC